MERGEEGERLSGGAEGAGEHLRVLPLPLPTLPHPHRHRLVLEAVPRADLDQGDVGGDGAAQEVGELCDEKREEERGLVRRAVGNSGG